MHVWIILGLTCIRQETNFRKNVVGYDDRSERSELCQQETARNRRHVHSCLPTKTPSRLPTREEKHTRYQDWGARQAKSGAHMEYRQAATSSRYLPLSKSPLNDKKNYISPTPHSPLAPHLNRFNCLYEHRLTSSLVQQVHPRISSHPATSPSP
jgi:hypothetical protein